MATVTPQPHESDVRDHPAPPDHAHPDAMSVDGHVNGTMPPPDPEPDFTAAPVPNSELDRAQHPLNVPPSISPKPVAAVTRDIPSPEPMIEAVSEPAAEPVVETVVETVVQPVAASPRGETPPSTSVTTETITNSEPGEPEAASLIERVQETVIPVQDAEMMTENGHVEAVIDEASPEKDAAIVTTTQTESIDPDTGATVETVQTMTTHVEAAPQLDVEPAQVEKVVETARESSASQPLPPISQEPVVAAVEAIPAPVVPSAVEPIEDQEMADVVQPVGKIAREREDDDEDEPTAKRTKTDDAPEAVPDVVPTVPASSEPIKLALNTDGISASPAAETLDSAIVPMSASLDSAVGNAGPEYRQMDWGPMTDAQIKVLKANIVAVKKTRHALNFLKPVDPVALNIPRYPEVIKNPMDLSTLEQKLKDGKYDGVNQLLEDFDLIVFNSESFNGADHAVTHAAKSMAANFNSQLKKVPKAGEPTQIQTKKQRKSSVALPQRDSKPRESRPSIGSAQSPTSAVSPTFALGRDGVPLTRRTSTAGDGRPKREIHKPPPRDLPYGSAKPKKKKYQMELKFCDYVLGEMKKGRYSHLMTPFSEPVDPVALNIPDYHKHIKKPMDFRTISEKLQNGHYENAKEFESDVKTVFANCYKFNGETHPVSQLAKQFEAIFDDMWSQKQAWISQNAPPSAPQSPEAESASEAEEEEEEEEDDGEERRREIASIHEKIAELSAQAMALSSAAPAKKPAKPAKKKTAKPAKGPPPKPSRKPSTVGTSKAAPAPPEKKSKPKAPKFKYLSMLEKEEIAERIGELSVEDTAKAAELIKTGLRKIGRADLADRPDEELEFDIAAIPDETLFTLLKLVRKNDAPAPVTQHRPAAVPAKATTTAKKKNKPMGKHEQEDAIRRLETQIESFGQQAGGVSAVEQSRQNNAISSGDEDDSASESEEE